MKFIILTQYYPPETGAPQRRLSDLAARLAGMGHQVQVLTAKPNYPEGRIFPGYRKGLVQREMDGDIETIRCWLYPNQSKNLALRLANYISFVVSSIIFGAVYLRKADFLLVESPQIFLGISGRFLSVVKRARLIFNVSDLYPESAISLGMLNQSFLQRIMFAFEAWCYSKADFITGQTEGIVDSIRSRFPDEKVHLLTNGIDIEAAPAPQFEGSGWTGEKRVIGYAGIIGHAQQLDAVVRSAARLKDQPDIEFRFFGDGPLLDDLRAQVEELGVVNLKILGRRPHDEILKDMQSWYAGLVPLANIDLMRGALPSKMFEVMGMRLPVILYAPAGEASLLIARAEAGVHVDANDEQKLADEILRLSGDQKLRDQLGKNARRYVEEYYNRQLIAERFMDFIGIE